LLRLLYCLQTSQIVEQDRERSLRALEVNSTHSRPSSIASVSRGTPGWISGMIGLPDPSANPISCWTYGEDRPAGPAGRGVIAASFSSALVGAVLVAIFPPPYARAGPSILTVPVSQASIGSVRRTLSARKEALVWTVPSVSRAVGIPRKPPSATRRAFEKTRYVNPDGIAPGTAPPVTKARTSN